MNEWAPTAHLRWSTVYGGRRIILQQLWVSNSGETEWRTVTDRGDPHDTGAAQ